MKPRQRIRRASDPDQVQVKCLFRLFAFILFTVFKTDGFVCSPSLSFAPTAKKSRSQSIQLAASSSRRSTASSKYSSYLATCIPGLSNVLAQELQSVGCQHVEVRGASAVSFKATVSEAIQALVWSRTAHKLMQQVSDCSGIVRDREDVSDLIESTVDVTQLLAVGGLNNHNKKFNTNDPPVLLTLAVQVVTAVDPWIPSDIRHTHFTSLTIKNALCDKCRDIFNGYRPNVDTETPQVPLVALIKGCEPFRSQQDDRLTAQKAEFTLYRQLHVGSLHKRGYRQDGVAIHKAAMKESLAAGLLYLSGWNQVVQDHLKEVEKKKDGENSPLILVDPMAGSGTLLLEATLMAADVAPGIMRMHCGGSRRPPFLDWSYVDEDIEILEVWKHALVDATERAKAGLQRLRALTENGQLLLLGNDVHPGAFQLFETALSAASLKSFVDIRCEDCSSNWMDSIVKLCYNEEKQDGSSIEGSTKTYPRVMVVTNPPWGEKRLTDDMNESWEALRVFLRESCPPNTEAWVLSGNPAATKHLGLRKSATHVIRTGQQDLRWLQYLIRDKTTTDRSKVGSSTLAFGKKVPQDGRGESKFCVQSEKQAPNGLRDRSNLRTSDRTKSLSRRNSKDLKRPDGTKRASKKKTAAPAENEWLI